MKIIKNSIFCTIIITTISNCLQPIGVAATKEFGNILSEQIPNVTKLVETAGDKGVQASQILLSDAAQKLGIEVAGKLAPIAGAAVAVYGITQLYPIGKEVAEYVHPSEEQKALSDERLKSVQQRLNLLDAENDFRQCLIKNRLNTDRASSGLPSVCEDAAEKFAFLGKRREVEETTAYFNKIRNQACSKE